jgi:hypothetical protein
MRYKENINRFRTKKNTYDRSRPVGLETKGYGLLILLAATSFPGIGVIVPASVASTVGSLHRIQESRKHYCENQPMDVAVPGSMI